MSQALFSRHIGIDVSKNTLDIYQLPEGIHFKEKNTKAGIKSLIKRLPKLDSGILLEATGGYERLASQMLSEEGFMVCVTNPVPVYHFRKSLSIAAKTDRVDARILALFAKERSDLRYGLRDKKQQELLDLQRAKDQLKKSKTQEKNRLRTCHHSLVKSVHAAVIKTLEKKIEKLDQAMKDIIDQHEAYQMQYDLLTSIKGISRQVATTLIASLPEMGNLRHKALQRLVGVAPINNDSGRFSGKRAIQGGRQDVRDALYMAALSAAHTDPYIKAYYQKKQAEGKKKKVALIACMAKLLRILNSVITHQKPYLCPVQ